MKKVKIVIFSILVFLTFMVNVKAEDTYTWACQYTYGNLGVKYQVTNIPESVLRNTQSLKNSGKNYVTVYYKNKTGSWVQTTSSYITDCNGCSIVAGFNPQGNLKQVSNNIAANSFKNLSVTCPQVYMDGGGSLEVTLYKNYSDETNGIYYDNKPMTVSSPTCQKNGKSTNCSNMLSSSEQDSGQPLSCEYKTDALSQKKSSFRLTYDEKNGLQFDGGTAGLKVVWMDKEALEQRFASARRQGKCPSRIVCNLKNGSKNVEVGVQSSTFSGSANCGEIISNNGQEIGDVGNYTELLLQGSPLEISDEKLPCDELLGKNLVKVLHLFITAVRIAGAIIAIISGMLALIPAVASNDANALKTATKKCVILAIILVAIGIFPTIVNIIGKIAGFDLSCL